MKKNSLYIKLKSAYTEENLNKISTRIIDSYRLKQYNYLQKLIQKLEDVINIKDGKINKTFSRLIMLYHPDKLNYYKNEIEKNHQNGGKEKLKRFSHILLMLENIDKIPISKTIDFDSVFSSEEQYMCDEDDFDDTINVDENEYDSEQVDYDDTYDQPIHDFLSVLKQKEFGNLDIDLYYHQLEILEGELELLNYGLVDLSGIEYCKNINSLDLSNNNIVDITNIGYLHLLEEIYLSCNSITSIDVMSGLTNLRKFDISFNNIDDISPLFNHPKLEYLNIIGNNIPDDQIDLLKKNGVVIIY